MVALPFPLWAGRLMAVMSSVSSGGQSPWLMMVQMPAVQKVVPKSKLGSASSCESPWVSATASMREKRRRFGEPIPTPLSVSRVACDTTVCETVAGDAVGYFSKTRAATPATNGADSEVPLERAAVVGLLYQSDQMFVPGAKRSTQLP